jgi:hypothetical protein
MDEADGGDMGQKISELKKIFNEDMPKVLLSKMKPLEKLRVSLRIAIPRLNPALPACICVFIKLVFLLIIRKLKS